ncbi:MAG: diguanylate cyclase [Anaerolineales bacterium]|nr:diguanylate cyclase [Anaerolineales bacterium]
MFKLTDISTILFITTIINLVVTIISWRRQDVQAGRYFAWAMLAITCWTFSSGLDYSATTIPLKILFAKFESLFYHCSLTLFVMFALAYSGYSDWLNKLNSQILLWSVTVINSLLVFTNEWHSLIWNGFTNNETVDNVLIFHHGPGFLWIVATNYIFVLSIFFFLWKAMQSASELTRRQAQFLIGATFFPIATNILYLFEIIPTAQGVDWTAVTFSFSGFLFLMALYGTRFLNIIPIANHLIIARMPDCVLVLDHNNYIIDFNPAMTQKFGITKNHLGEKIETVMMNWHEVIQLTLSDVDPPPLEVIVDSPTLSVFDTRLTRLVDERNQLYGKLIVFRNVTVRYKTKQELQQQLIETQELHIKVQYLAERDSLTDAYTRRYLYEKLSEWINYKTPFIAALLDIDKFKQINDIYGHTVGDEVLIGLTKQLFAMAEENDVVCRYGGEEFVVAIQNTSSQEVLSEFEKVLKNFREFCFSKFNVGITISIGLAEYPIDSEKLDEILNLADKAMYQAKSAGGNQIIVFSKK